MASDDPSMLAFASIAKPPPTMAELGVVPCDIDTLATEPPALSAKAVDEEPLLPSPTKTQLIRLRSIALYFASTSIWRFISSTFSFSSGSVSDTP